jgi:hypothetical protein
VAPVLVRPEVLPPPARAKTSVPNPIQTRKNRTKAKAKKARGDCLSDFKKGSPLVVILIFVQKSAEKTMPKCFHQGEKEKA